MSVQRKNSFIMFTDIEGYTSLMESDEKEALSCLDKYERIMHLHTKAHEGDIINFYGDGCLCLHENVTNALGCAEKIQDDFSNNNMTVRLGIHYGEVVLKNGNAFGNSINIASRIESLGQSGVVLVSENAFSKVDTESCYKFQKLGNFEFKNLENPLGVYAMNADSLHIPDISRITGKLRPKSDQSILVLPFKSNGSEDISLAGSVSDEIRDRLSAIDSLKVISKSSAVNYFNNRALTNFATDFEDSVLLEGCVTISNGVVGISIELTEMRSGKTIWSSKEVTRPLHKLFEIQQFLLSRVIEELEVLLSIENRISINRIPTEYNEAFREYQKGVELLQLGSGNIQEINQSINCFKNAINIDPNYGKAFLGIAEGYLDSIYWGRARANDALVLAEDFISKALDIEGETGDVLSVVGSVRFHQLNIRSAEKYLERSLKISSSCISSFEKLAWIRMYQEDFSMAFELLKKASQLDPFSLKYPTNMGHIFYYRGDYEEGLNHICALEEVRPNEPWIYWMKGYLYSVQGEFEKAIESFEKRETIGKKSNWMLAYCLAKIGRVDEANAVLEFHLNKSKFSHVPAYMIATIYMGLNRYEEAIDWLYKDYSDGGTGHFFINIHHDPKFTPLKGYERFDRLLALTLSNFEN